MTGMQRISPPCHQSSIQTRPCQTDGKEIVFFKYQACGNDFVIIQEAECLAETENNLGVDLAVKHIDDYSRLALRLCDRHFGIGADGLIAVKVLAPLRIQMRYFNLDGSEALCANGLRAVAEFAVRQGLVPSSEKVLVNGFIIETNNNGVNVIHRVELHENETPRVEVGEASFDPKIVPCDSPTPVLHKPWEIDGYCFNFSAVSVGNPHCVVSLPLYDGKTNKSPLPFTREVFAQLGATIENHPLFPQRTNIEFIEVINPGHVRAYVWERGVGETLACGTGAAAIQAVGAELGTLNCRLQIDFPGGTLFTILDPDTNKIWLKGGVSEVFRGCIILDSLE